MNSSSIIAEGSHHLLSAYGSLLPVLVVEAISSETVSGKSLSVKIADNGWAWLVCGRRLLIWKFKSTKRTSDCFELELPPSDLSLKADLVCLIPNAGHRTSQGSLLSNAVVAVSPEGILRFWPNISYESHSIEVVVTDLQGHECCSLTQLSTFSLLLGTTTGTLVHINVHQSVPEFRLLKTNQGILAGFGRKVSSFIFGGIPSHPADTKSLVRVLRTTVVDDRVTVYILIGSTVQKWIFVSDNECLIYEQDLDQTIRNCLLESVWSRGTSDPRLCEVFIIDSSLKNNDGIVLVISFSNQASGGGSNSLAVASFLDRDQQLVLENFRVIHNSNSRFNQNTETGSLKMMLSPRIPSLIFLFDENQVILVSGDTIKDSIDFNARDDGILGAGVCDDDVLLFTHREALVALTPKAIQVDNIVKTIGLPVNSPSMSLLEHIRKACSQRASKQLRESSQTLASAISASTEQGPQSSLSNALCQFATEACNATERLSSKSSVKQRSQIHPISEDSQMMLKIEDKIHTLKTLIDMIHENELEEHLDNLVDGIPARLVISQLHEKLLIALKLRSLHSGYSHIIEPVIRCVFEKRRPAVGSSSLQDAFYSEVTKIEEFFPAAVAHQESEMSMSHSSYEENYRLVSSFTEVIVLALREVGNIRKDLHYNKYKEALNQFTPWDASVGESGLRSSFLKQLELVKDCSLQSRSGAVVMQPEVRKLTCSRIADLADVVFRSFSHQIGMLRPDSQDLKALVSDFASCRQKFYSPLISQGDYEHVTPLAEKYHDFEVLIEICEKNGRPEILDKYCSDFTQYNFAQTLFKWYEDRGKSVKMLNTSAQNPGLIAARSDLRWLQQIESEDFIGASATLHHLAQKENNLVKKKTILSLCKLSALISGDVSKQQDINEQLDEIVCQSQNLIH